MDEQIGPFAVDGHQEDAAAALVRRYGVGDGVEGGHAGHRQSSGQGHTARRRQTDPEAGEGAGTNRHADQADRGPVETRLGENSLDHRHQHFSLTAGHDLGAAGQQAARPADGGRTALGAAVEGENVHGAFFPVGRTAAAILPLSSYVCKGCCCAGLVPISPLLFDVDLALAYATAQNFTGKPVFGSFAGRRSRSDLAR